MTYRGQLCRAPVPAKLPVGRLLQVCRLVRRRRELAQPGEVRGGRAETAGPAEEESVEELASLDRCRQLKRTRATVRAAGDYAAPLAPQAQVIDGAQGIAGVRVTSLFSRVDEVEGHVSRYERDFGDGLHNIIVPAKSALPV